MRWMEINGTRMLGDCRLVNCRGLVTAALLLHQHFLEYALNGRTGWILLHYQPCASECYNQSMCGVLT